MPVMLFQIPKMPGRFLSQGDSSKTLGILGFWQQFFGSFLGCLSIFPH